MITLIMALMSNFISTEIINFGVDTSRNEVVMQVEISNKYDYEIKCDVSIIIVRDGNKIAASINTETLQLSSGEYEIRTFRLPYYVTLKNGDNIAIIVSEYENDKISAEIDSSNINIDSIRTVAKRKAEKDAESWMYVGIGGACLGGCLGGGLAYALAASSSKTADIDYIDSLDSNNRMEKKVYISTYYKVYNEKAKSNALSGAIAGLGISFCIWLLYLSMASYY